MKDERKIPVVKAMLMGVNIMVGAGILTGPAKMAAVAGRMSFWGWIIAAALYLPVVLSLARMAEIMPDESGFYAYCRAGLGNFLGFVGGWSYFVGYACSTAALLSAYRDFLVIKFPSIWMFSNSYLFFMIAVLILMMLNSMKTSIIASMQSYLTIVKLIPVISAVLLLPFFFKMSSLTPNVASLMKVPSTLTFAVFGYTGFEFCASMVDVIEGGAQKAKQAIVGGFLIVTGLYVAFHLSLLNIMGSSNLVQKTAAGFPLFVVDRFPALGAILLVLIPVATILTFFNSSNGLMFLDSKVLASLAESNNVRMADTLNQRNGYDRPIIAVMTVALLVFSLTLFVPSTAVLMSITNFGVGLTLLLACISLFIADTNSSKIDFVVNVLAIVALTGMLIYSVSQAGATLIQSLQNMTLFFAAMLAGIVLYKSN